MRVKIENKSSSCCGESTRNIVIFRGDSTKYDRCDRARFGPILAFISSAEDEPSDRIMTLSLSIVTVGSVSDDLLTLAQTTPSNAPGVLSRT